MLRVTLVGCMNAHQFDARGRQGRKLNSEHLFFSRLTKARAVVGKGEECVPCDPGYELRKGDWQSNAPEIRVDETKTKCKHKWTYFLHFWCVYWSVGCCISQSIAISVPGTWRFKTCIFWPPKKASQFYYVQYYSPDHWKHWMNDDIQQKLRVRQQCRTESLKALNNGISTRRDVCQPLVVTTTTTMYSIDFIHYLCPISQPEIPDHVNNNIHQVPRTC